MKSVVLLMIVAGVVLGAGALLEFRYFGPDARQFWAGAFTMPACVLFVAAGLRLWRHGPKARRLVLISAFVMFLATVAATAIDVMGPPATLTGLVAALVAILWAWRSASAVPA